MAITEGLRGKGKSNWRNTPTESRCASVPAGPAVRLWMVASTVALQRRIRSRGTRWACVTTAYTAACFSSSSRSSV